MRDNEKKIRTAFPRSLKSIALSTKLPIVYENSRLFCVRVKKEEGRGGKKEAAALFLTVPGRFQFFAIPLGDPAQEKKDESVTSKSAARCKYEKEKTEEICKTTTELRFATLHRPFLFDR